MFPAPGWFELTIAGNNPAMSRCGNGLEAKRPAALLLLVVRLLAPCRRARAVFNQVEIVKLSGFLIWRIFYGEPRPCFARRNIYGAQSAPGLRLKML
jgi:hypothetical protein